MACGQTGSLAVQKAGGSGDEERRAAASNSVAGGLAADLGVRGCVGGQKGPRCRGVCRDGGRERVQPVVPGLVAKFVQQFHAGEFTVAPLGSQGPLQAMDLQQHAASVLDRGPVAQAGDAGQRLGGEAVHAHREDAMRGRLVMREAQVQRAETVRRTGLALAELAAELATVGDMAGDRIRPPQQRGRAGHVARGQGLAHGRAADAQAAHLIAHHAGHVEAARLAGSVQRRVIALALGAKAEVVAHQHVLRAQAIDQHLADEVLRGQGGERLVEGQDDHLVHAAAFELDQLVAQRGDAGRRQLGLAGLGGEEVARMRLEGQHAARQATVAGLGLQQRQHGLVAAVHAVEIADGQRAGGRDAGMVEASEHSHRTDCPCSVSRPRPRRGSTPSASHPAGGRRAGSARRTAGGAGPRPGCPRPPPCA
mmetsp:Transcript_70428/g.165811  ORF Transcript_70428/g.165811 Transcript_70428/m.165811 type:complete len:423 (-) Transcript_70428:2047-3315(-)